MEKQELKNNCSVRLYSKLNNISNIHLQNILKDTRRRNYEYESHQYKHKYYDIAVRGKLLRVYPDTKKVEIFGDNFGEHNKELYDFNELYYVVRTTPAKNPPYKYEYVYVDLYLLRYNTKITFVTGMNEYTTSCADYLTEELEKITGYERIDKELLEQDKKDYQEYLEKKYIKKR